MCLPLPNDNSRGYRPALPSHESGRGGIGRRAALRSLWGKTRGGSIPLDRTTKSNLSVYFQIVTEFIRTFVHPLVHLMKVLATLVHVIGICGAWIAFALLVEIFIRHRNKLRVSGSAISVHV
jgi:hypothetical protein